MTLAAAACENSGSQPRNSAQPTPAALTPPDETDALGRHILYIDVKMTGLPGYPGFTGTTNLPHGTSLMITLRSDKLSYMGQQTVTVYGGRFMTTRFERNGGQKLFPGRYTVDISAPLSDLQPPSVQEQVGTAYENYVGPQFDEGEFGRSIDYSVEFDVEGKAGADDVELGRQEQYRDMHRWAVNECAATQRRAGLPTKTDSAIAKIDACADELLAKVYRSVGKEIPR